MNCPPFRCKNNYPMPLNCELIVNSDVEHLRQIYTGFALLHRQGVLYLKQTIKKNQQNKNDSSLWLDYKFFNAKVVLNGKTIVYYDAHDWNRIDEEILSEADFYFKRSYDPAFVSGLREGKKVFPLGLNYEVSSSRPDWFRVQRAALYAGKDRLKAVIKALATEIDEAGRLDFLEAAPNFDLPPKILFMTRAWDTALIEDKGQKESVERLNETRAASVRALRKEFGKDFFGGLAHDDYAVRHFKDCLLPDMGLSNKRKYLEILKNFPICVTTVGLNGSNGWKLGEYVAFSKAVITEPLQYTVPGDFAKDVNYLEFSTPEELVEKAARLFKDKTKRDDMMRANLDYYLNYVRPDRMIFNTLQIAQT